MSDRFSMMPWRFEVLGEVSALDATPSSEEDVAEGVRRLWSLFTKARAETTRSYLNEPKLLQAYLQYYLPINLAKVQVLLDELPENEWCVASERTLRVLDVGAGPGTGSLAILSWMTRKPHHFGKLEVVAVDRSRRALALAQRLWKRLDRDPPGLMATMKTHCLDMERLAEVQRWCDGLDQRFDLIIIGNTLNEWFRADRDPIGRRTRIVTKLLGVLSTSGSMMILEPALREHTRALHELRDALLRENLCTVYSPCLHDHPCPALAHPDDWCHEERSWSAPEVVLRVDRAVGFQKDALKFSYLILRKDRRTIVSRVPGLVRIVSERRGFKGELRVWGCGETGRREIGRLDRARSFANAAFDQVERGTIVRIEGHRGSEGSTLERVPAEATVEIVRPV